MEDADLRVKSTPRNESCGAAARGEVHLQGAVSGGDFISGLHLSCVTHCARQRHIAMAFLPDPLSAFPVSEGAV